MMDLKMDVYSPSLELIGMHETHKSVIWEEKAFTSGSFSFESIITGKSMSLLQPENIIWIEGDTAGIIEYVQKTAGKSGPYITVKGCTLTGILGRHILWGRYNLTGTPPAIMHRLVSDCCINPTRGDIEARKIPGLVLMDVPHGGSSIRVQKTGGTLLEELEQLGETYGVAFGVRLNPAVPQMKFWTRWGRDLTIHQNTNPQVFYSTELNDVLSSEYTYNSNNYRNVALVAGEGEGDSRTMVTVNGKVNLEPEPPAPPEPPTPPPPITKYTITASIDPAGSGTVVGAGTYSEGAQVTIKAVPREGYQFTGWQENGHIVSENTEYTFTVNANRSLVAVFAVEQTSRLPDGYVEVEYIESGGVQCIDTGVTPSDTTKIEIDVFPTKSATSTNGFIFGSVGTVDAAHYIWKRLSLYRNSSGINASCGSTIYNVSTDASARRFLAGVNVPDETAYVDDASVSLKASSDSFASNPSIHLLSNKNDTNSPTAFISAKLYSCQIFSGETIIRNFVPCVNPNGTVGLYDLAEGKFYANAGTGAFTPGPAV